MNKKNEFSRSAWVRTVLIRRPDITLEQLQKEYDKESLPKDKRPNKLQNIYQARSELHSRWGIESLDDLPRNKDKSINISGMTRLYLDKFGLDKTEKMAKSYFAADGILLKKGAFSNQKTVYMQSKGVRPEDVNPSEESPDLNQNNGPRAGKPPKKEKKTRVTNDISLDTLIKLKSLVKETGGFNQIREALKQLEKLVN